MTKKIAKLILLSLAGAAVIAGLFLLSRFNYLLFHFSIEIASIIIGVCLFIIVINTFRLTNNVFLLFLGTSFLTCSVIDLLHTITYKGMNIIPGITTNIPTQLWVSSRFIQAACLLIAPFILDRLTTKRCIILTSIFFPLIFAGIVLSIFYFKNFPVCYIDGLGLTSFKKISEYIISGIFLGSIIIFTIKRKLIKEYYFLILFSLIFSILSELSFTLYTDVFGLYNTLGHLFKVISFIFIYRIFIGISLRNPFDLLFKNLKDSNKKLAVMSSIDGLTGLSNQATVFKELKKQYDIAKRFDKNFSIIMIDIDNFKNINDVFGHAAGDEALKCLANIIKSAERKVDIKGRFGGDEFIISPIETDVHASVTIIEKIMVKLKSADPTGGRFGPFKIAVSAGVSGLRGDKTLDDIISDADKALHESKKNGKNRVTILV
jgi:diguanylate cyclase (GGDEF)-like protein